MPATDTHRDAQRAQLEVYRRLGPQARVELTARMSEDARRIALQGILARHPGYDDRTARRALLRLLLGDDLVRAMWPGEPLVAP
jgi:hypothetical protein